MGGLMTSILLKSSQKINYLKQECCKLNHHLQSNRKNINLKQVPGKFFVTTLTNLLNYFKSFKCIFVKLTSSTHNVGR